MASGYTDIIFEIRDRIGIIKFNRPNSLNAFGGELIPETISALRELNEHPDTIFTVITGTGRFFSAGADVRAASDLSQPTSFKNAGEKKLAFLNRFTYAIELLRSMIDHRKVLVVALNGPGVGGGAAWFPSIADIVLASNSAYLQCPFSALGLVPENGSALSFAQHIGIHRANDFLMFGRKLSAKECLDMGLFNYVWEVAEGERGVTEFHAKVNAFLEEQLRVNDGASMMEMKRLQNERTRSERMLAVINAVDALAERFVADAPQQRFAAKKEEMEAKSKARAKI